MKSVQYPHSDKNLAMTVSFNSIIVNIVLSIFKFLAGVFAKSGAMISDSIHSASDVFSTIIVIIGVKISGKEADREHQYGHERYECVAAIVLAVILMITGAAIGYEAILKIIEGKYQDLVIPGKFALIAAVMSIIVKEAMYWYTRNAAKKINSTALMADAWHHRSDALSSVGSLMGIAGARMGFPILDKVASLGICFFIVKAALSIFADAIRKMIDESCDKELEEKMRLQIKSQEGVIAIDILKTRKFGDKVYVDVEIVVDGTLSLLESHRIAEKVHDEVEHQFAMVKHCMVHVNPDNNIKTL